MQFWICILTWETTARFKAQFKEVQSFHFYFCNTTSLNCNGLYSKEWLAKLTNYSASCWLEKEKESSLPV